MAACTPASCPARKGSGVSPEKLCCLLSAWFRAMDFFFFFRGLVQEKLLGGMPG